MWLTVIIYKHELQQKFNLIAKELHNGDSQAAIEAIFLAGMESIDIEKIKADRLQKDIENARAFSKLSKITINS